MSETYHILNGDALKSQFPRQLTGLQMVARECLMDGDVTGDSLESLYKTRARFIASSYEGYDESDYFDKTVPEFEKIQNIPTNAEVNLWFEDDLFCQVNMWFVVHLLVNHVKDPKIFLVRPPVHSRYSFGRLSESELMQAYQERVALTEPRKIANLWVHYQSGQITNLSEQAATLSASYPFISAAVEAHIARIPDGDSPGRPVASLRQIVGELKTEDFGTVFQEFCRREAIYGYGDLQVKRLMDEFLG